MIKKIIKKQPFLKEYLTPPYRFLKNIPRLFGYYNAPKMLEGELNLFRSICSDFKLIIDVGARFDVNYVELSQGMGIKYFLFEANPKFYARLLDNLKGYEEDINVENLAIGEREDFVDYYEDSESLLINTTSIKNSKHGLKKKIKMIRLESYLSSLEIEAIDFLKTDIEEYDYFAILGLGAYLNRCKYIQFELGIGAPIGNSFISSESYYEMLESAYHLYVIRDENNPIWSTGYVNCDLISVDIGCKEIISRGQRVGVGFNLLAVNKNIGINKLSTLNISAIDFSGFSRAIF